MADENLDKTNVYVESGDDDKTLIGGEKTLMGGDKTRIKAVRNIHFSNVHATGKHFPSFVGRESAPLQNFTFDNCSFVREAAPDQIEPELFQYTEGFKFNGTTFTARVVKSE